jgi:dihydrofolate reductase
VAGLKKLDTPEARTLLWRARAELKQRPGKNIGMTGSATLVSSLLREGPLDEPHLLIFPVLLGSGNRRSAAASGRPGGRRTARYGR